MVPSTRRRAKRSKEPKEHKQQLVNIPLDVLIEIFLFLDPLDLLHLARTTKGLREFFLNRRRSSAIWNNAISNVKDFPPCPDHMSAPAYTHLAFVPVCHGCSCPCETVEWELRMRCCPDCFPKMTIPRMSVYPSKRYRYDFGLPIAVRHYKLEEDFGWDVVVSLENVDPPSFSISDWKVFESRKSPKISMGEALARQNDYWRPIRMHARLCQDWEYEKLRERAIQLSLVREQRVEEIKNKLNGLGWADVVSSHSPDDDFWRLPQVRRLEPLTSAEWTKIRCQLISWARKARKDLIWNRCMSILTSVSLSILQELNSDTSLKVRPRGVDIAMLPAVQSMIESNIESDINPDTGRDELRKKLFRVLPPAIKKWSLNAVEQLEQFAREQLGLSPQSKPSFLLSVIFRCKACSRGVERHSRYTFGEALLHDHLYKEKRKADEKKNRGEVSTCDRVLLGCDTHPRNIQVLQVDVTVSRRVENLIKRMGQNPDRVAYDALCHSTVKVVCGLCRPEVVIRMGFEYAFDHCLSSHLRDKETEVWTRVSTRE